MSVSLDFQPDLEDAMSYREFDADDEIWGYSPTVTWFQYPVEFVVDGIELIPRLSQGGLDAAKMGLAIDLDRAVENARSGNETDVALNERPCKLLCTPTGSTVAISSNATNSAATVDIEELAFAVSRFCEKLTAFVSAYVPQLPELTGLEEWFAAHGAPR